MKFHIVREGETIKDIMFLYSVTIDELKEDNRHIRKWDRLIPGTKLKISVITKNDDDEILQMEPFIEDYYPKDISVETINVKDNSDEVKIASSEEIFKIDEIKQEEVTEESSKKDIVNVEDNLENSKEKNESNKAVSIKENNYSRSIRSGYRYLPYVVYYPVYYNPYYNYYYTKKRK